MPLPWAETSTAPYLLEVREPGVTAPPSCRGAWGPGGILRTHQRRGLQAPDEKTRRDHWPSPPGSRPQAEHACGSRTSLRAHAVSPLHGLSASPPRSPRGGADGVLGSKMPLLVIRPQTRRNRRCPVPGCRPRALSTSRPGRQPWLPSLALTAPGLSAVCLLLGREGTTAAHPGSGQCGWGARRRRGAAGRGPAYVLPEHRPTLLPPACPRNGDAAPALIADERHGQLPGRPGPGASWEGTPARDPSVPTPLGMLLQLHAAGWCHGRRCSSRGESNSLVSDSVRGGHSALGPRNGGREPGSAYVRLRK